MTRELSDHFIVCGFGALGRAVGRELHAAEATFVAIGSQSGAGAASMLSIPFIGGDPSDPALLLEAGVQRARALVACTGADANDIATTRAARELRPDLPIVACHSGEDDEHKIARAGADSVVSPIRTGGVELARRALHPLAGERQEYRIAEVTVVADASGAGHAISALRGRAFIVALKRPDGTFLPQPPADAVLRPGDTAMVLGTDAAIARIEQLLAVAAAEEAPAASALPRTTRRL